MRTATKTTTIPAPLPALLLALLLAALLAACSGGGESASSGARARPEAPRADGGAATGRPAAAPARSIIHRAQLRVRAPDVDAASTRAKQLTAAAGGYVADERTSTRPASATLTLKIPADRYPATLDQLAAQLGTRLSLSRQSEDVTGEVADVDSRVRSARSTLDSFRRLLGRAGSIDEVIRVEKEIAERQADLEALQARQKALRQGTGHATVTVEIGAPPSTPVAEPDRRGFVGGLTTGWSAFTAFVSGAATVLGVLLPFLLPVAAVGVPARILWRRTRARRPAEPGRDG
ncbi:hypothetical protein GCM10009678_63700 [Actinomadura kijaniata]|uniref:DUF4349 domain-containing protein n=1 Tax=Actinomadura namibiensis TaxID=182080 RepID=A0A7W3LPX9_ACTNM|nr:DUF4349 domain-containing protein [Actinomadura namibiensis]MBA8952141.1 hypothetical protein [Actinomadura namibiensis]